MIRTILVAISLLFAPTSTGTSPLADLPTRPIDIELEAAPVGDVLGLVASIVERPFEIDACVTGQLDLSLRGVTPRLLLETLASQLDLVYSDAPGGALAVGCSAESAERRVTLELRDARPTDAFAMLARQAGHTASVTGCDDATVDLEVANAPVGALVAGLASELEAEHSWTATGLHVRCRPSTEPTAIVR